MPMILPRKSVERAFGDCARTGALLGSGALLQLVACSSSNRWCASIDFQRQVVLLLNQSFH